ncbi:restriction endonuclease subunit S [Corynebacterium sp. ES2794-CONJ1]|uniref:restriction endonuclease subunit S n=1 Tax=Corynebacterium sp. ES2794-CONJ1 TaxID=2980553 RepID=UPI0021D9A8D6|nr:restriction endonuclease subunit S [Corynebacterium sp. ES2794-CONJ1]MCU9519737.1 restriction endonuclease subunit S [Corynebacterium sp. ES2794-CONJ1]
MNRIERLIQQHCPNGVPVVPINQVVKYEQPTRYLVNSKEYRDFYETPVLTAGKAFILGKTNEKHGIKMSSPEDPVIIFDDFTTSFKWVDFPFKVKSSALKILSVDSEILDIRYLFHTMQTIGYPVTDHSRQWISKYSQLNIPIPPLEIQREIVDILDSFTELEAELEAELIARRQQYEYYRDQLLTFKELKV